MQNDASKTTLSHLLSTAKKAAFALSGVLRLGATTQVFAGASGNVSSPELIASTLRAMEQSAHLVGSITGTLSAIVEELDGVSSDPTDHVSVALVHARGLLEQLASTQGLKPESTLASFVAAKEGDRVATVGNYTIKVGPDSCHVYHEEDGDVYYAHIVDLRDTSELRCPCGGPDVDRVHEVASVDLDAINAWIDGRNIALAA